MKLSVFFLALLPGAVSGDSYRVRSMHEGGGYTPVGPTPTSAGIASKVQEDEAPLTCEDENATSVEEGCICSEVTLIGIDFLTFDCGFCTVCSTNHSLEPEGELACVRERSATLTPTMASDESELVTIDYVLYVDILPDGTESAFEIYTATYSTFVDFNFTDYFNFTEFNWTDDFNFTHFNWTDDFNFTHFNWTDDFNFTDFNWTDDFNFTDFNWTYYYPTYETLNFTMNGIPCEIVDDSEFCLVVDCTAVPGVDQIVDFCDDTIDYITEVPQFTFWFYDYSDFEGECLDAFGEVVTTTVVGDPHIETFDGLKYDCQGHGEFILVTSSDSSLEIQGRFEEPVAASGQTSVMTGLAIEHDGEKFEIVIDDMSSDDCAATHSGMEFTVDETMDEIIIRYPETFLEVVINRRKSATFGCFWSVAIALPVSTGVTYMGLYGSPDGDATNDWMQPDGTVIALPADSNQLLFQPAYDYCTDNWCITTEGDSLFTHVDGEFDALNGCGVAYNSDIEMAVGNASDSLKAICGDDMGCLVDGVLGNESDAHVVLEDMEEFEEIIEEMEEVAQDPVDVQEDIIIEQDEEEEEEVVDEEEEEEEVLEEEEEEGDNGNDGGDTCGIFCRFTCGVIGG